MKRYEVHLLARARREYAVALAWWRINREKNPTLLRDEMRAARKRLSRFPMAGEMDRDSGGEIHRLLLARSHYFLYYRVDHAARRVEIIRLWEAHQLPPTL